MFIVTFLSILVACTAIIGLSLAFINGSIETLIITVGMIIIFILIIQKQNIK